MGDVCRTQHSLAPTWLQTHKQSCQHLTTPVRQGRTRATHYLQLLSGGAELERDLRAGLAQGVLDPAMTTTLLCGRF